MTATEQRPVGDRGWVVSCDLEFTIAEPALIGLQVAAARGAGPSRDERFVVAVDGTALPAPRELATPGGGRLHLLRAPRGSFTLSYRAEIDQPDVEHEPVGAGDDLPGLEQLTYLRPSRYCPSDHVVGFAVAEFGRLPPGRHGWRR